jgi:hypothetical protein
MHVNRGHVDVRLRECIASVPPLDEAAMAEARVRLLYMVGLDQGLLLSFVEGKIRLDQNLIHEFVHDARHSAAFPCH